MSQSLTNIKPRGRALGLPFPGETGPYNAITDVPGVEVGYTTLIQGKGKLEVGQGPTRTGVTAILPAGKQDRLRPIWAGTYNLNGNGEMTGTHWINDAGYLPMSGKIVDVSMVAAPRQRNAKDEKDAIIVGKSADETWLEKPPNAVQKDTDAR